MGEGDHRTDGHIDMDALTLKGFLRLPSCINPEDEAWRRKRCVAGFPPYFSLSATPPITPLPLIPPLICSRTHLNVSFSTRGPFVLTVCPRLKVHGP